MILFRKSLLVLSFGLVLAACESSEEKAEAYYESAQSLIETGDTDRAMIELRNVFEFSPNHVEARIMMARLMMEQGNKSGAYSQYLRLVEQVPSNVEGRTTLAEIAFEARNWAEFERHGQSLVELAPDAPRTKIVELALQYRNAVVDEDEPAGEAIIVQAEALSKETSDSLILDNILIDGYVRAGDYASALEALDQRIARTPDTRALYDQRLRLLGQMNDAVGAEAQLREMINRFPDDITLKSQLVQFLIASNRVDDAEAFMREIADPAAEDPGLFVDLIRFVSEARGEAAARAEIQRAIEVNPNPERFEAMLAALDFQAGQREQGISNLQAILDRSEPSEQTNDLKTMLARMLATTGNQVGAQRLVDEVLAENDSHVEALKMRAAWQIRADETDAAIASLRLALDTAPEDVQAMNLMAEAYTRAGSHDLARDFLALAVDTSNNAVEPSLRYARLLAEEERYTSAEEVLIPALRRSPQNLQVLTLLGSIYLAMEDFGRVNQVIEGLRRIGSEEAIATANNIETGLLVRREGSEQALGFLEELATGDDADFASRISLLRAKLSVGEAQEALSLAEGLYAEYPENPNVQYVLAVAQAAAGNVDDALGLLRTMVEAEPSLVAAWRQIYRLQRIEGDIPAALETVEAALAANPGNLELLLIDASEKEFAGDIEGAIAVYEDLYERNSSVLVVANNLASLLSTYRDDEDSLQRAWAAARRLRGTDVPAFQDTYGWLAFRRGDPQEALPYLEGAAENLPDPLVFYHLARVYAELDRPDDALATYQKSVEAADEDDSRSQIVQARQEIERLKQVVE